MDDVIRKSHSAKSAALVYFCIISSLQHIVLDLLCVSVHIIQHPTHGARQSDRDRIGAKSEDRRGKKTNKKSGSGCKKIDPQYRSRVSKAVSVTGNDLLNYK